MPIKKTIISTIGYPAVSRISRNIQDTAGKAIQALHDTAIEAVSALTHLQRHTETVPTTQILSESTNTKIFKRTDTCQEELLEVTQENDTAYKLRVQAECLNSWKKNISG